MILCSICEGLSFCFILAPKTLLPKPSEDFEDFEEPEDFEESEDF